jgi:hypothetical protein
MLLSTKVGRVTKGEEISMAELAIMVEHAALSSGTEGFNRRYHHWLFRVETDGSDTVVRDMRYAESVRVGQGQHQQSEEHFDCCGAGCKTCGWAGEVIRLVSDKPTVRSGSGTFTQHRPHGSH